jgi:adenosylmethionine-8-amino-7-oxononanoate aminotransferase
VSESIGVALRLARLYWDAKGRGNKSKIISIYDSYHGTAHGVVGMSRSQGNEIVKRLLTKYEEDIPQALKGGKYQERWDIQSKEPKPEYLKLYQKIKQELAEDGIQFKF